METKPEINPKELSLMKTTKDYLRQRAKRLYHFRGRYAKDKMDAMLDSMPKEFKPDISNRELNVKEKRLDLNKA